MKPFCILGLFLFLLSASGRAQAVDSLQGAKDSVKVTAVTDTVKVQDSVNSLNKAAKQNDVLTNKLLNTEDIPVSLAVQPKKMKQPDTLFYLLACMVLLLAFLRFFYSQYFTNLFRVFFNTSLRQNQITDQLLQAKLPSFLFNIFFMLSAGIYLFVLSSNYRLFEAESKWLVVFLLVVLMALIYFVKFCTLKFTGWVTGLNTEVSIYIFVIFLINKIIGVFLIPFTIVLAFSAPGIARVAALVSLMSIGLFLLLRFFRSYALVQNQLKISKFHFFLYLAGLEILPLLLIYKGLMIYLSKNL